MMMNKFLDTKNLIIGVLSLSIGLGSGFAIQHGNYDKGYDKGYDEGYVIGHKKGVNEGHDEGIKIGYNEARFYNSTGRHSSKSSTADTYTGYYEKWDNTSDTSDNVTYTYVGNKNTKKFHKPSCSSVKQMKDSNKKYFDCSRDEIIDNGYSPCGRCNP